MTVEHAPLRIASDIRGRPWHIRAGGALITLVGYVLLAAGIVAAVPALALLIGVVFAAGTGEGLSFEAVLALVLLTAAAWLLVTIGLRVARRRRHLVLFLRRFGFNDASRALTLAVSGAMGRRWRLVTLDDTRVEAVGSAGAERHLFGIGRWLFLGITVVAVFLALRWFMGDGIDRILSGIFDDALASAEESGANAFEATVGALFAMVAAGVVIVGLLLVFGVLGLSTLGVTSAAIWGADHAMRRAEGSKALHLDEGPQIRGVVARIRRGSRRVQAPRLVVVKVHDDIWRDVVRALGEEASVAVVDISDPTEHLVWEIRLLQSEIRARLLLIGRRDRVEALVAGIDIDAAEAQLRALLAGESVLVYDGGDPKAMRRFVRDLNATLEATPA